MPLSGSYTAAEVLTFFTAAGVLITGVGAVIVNIIVALRTGTKLDTSIEQGKVLATRVDEVHTLTNSNLAQLKTELAKVLAQNAALQEMVNDLRAERDKGQVVAAALAVPQPPVRNSRVTDQANQTLDRIEENTGAIANNTAPLADLPEPPEPPEAA